MNYIQLKKASSMWSRGFDTAAIAKRLHLPEAKIYANLEAIKDGASILRGAA